MNRWNQYTLFRLLVAYIAGMLFEQNLPINLKVHPVVFLVLLVLLVSSQSLISRFKAYRFRWVPGLLLAFVMLFFGYEWSRLNDQRTHPKHISNLYSVGDPVIVRIKSAPEIRPNSYKAVAEIVAVEQDSIWIKSRGNILIYFPKDSISQDIRYNDKLLITARLIEIAPPQNPGEYDYRGFLANKNIYHQVYAKRDEWVKIGNVPGNVLVLSAFKLREIFISTFQKHGITGRDFAVANALILGLDDYLDNDTRKEFAATGAMHILCVSGLHVGVVFLVLKAMLFFLQRNRYSRLLQSVLLLAGIWFYALLTGLAPSVMRAATMFSFVIIGMNLQRSTNIYNSLVASAFILLIFNPYLIREIGFQLSYIAVISIVTIQPGIQKLWLPKNWFIKQIWSITTVSIAAQIGTAPLGLYYFHQFPNYFIITNLVVIPLSSVILYAGFLTVIVSAIPLVSGWVSWLLALLLKILNGSVGFIDGLPYSVSTGIFISMVEMLILFLVIMAAFRALAFRRVAFLHFFLALMILFFGLGAIRQYERATQRQLIVYAFRNDVAIDLIQGRQSILLITAEKLKDPSVLDFQVAGNHTRRGIEQKQIITFEDIRNNLQPDFEGIPLRIYYPLLQFGDLTCLLTGQDIPLVNEDIPMKIDILILLENHYKPDVILKNIHTGQVVISNKVSGRAASYWVNACADAGIPVHYARNQGAFVGDASPNR